MLTTYQELWLKALESGNFHQCVGTLHGVTAITSEDGSHTTERVGHCCLGVADLVLSLDEPDGATLSNTYEQLGLWDRSGMFMKSGAGASSARIKVGDVWYSGLTCMNDGKAYRDEHNYDHEVSDDAYKLTFKQIAQAVRENAHLVFRAPQVSPGS